ncbi:MAG: BrnT family toxin [Acidobacteriaceae bacterium]
MSFEEASPVFRDPLYVSVQDRSQDGEECWQTFGLVDSVLLSMVAHTVRQESVTEEVIRIISARRATANERRRYEDEND